VGKGKEQSSLSSLKLDEELPTFSTAFWARNEYCAFYQVFGHTKHQSSLPALCVLV